MIERLHFISGLPRSGSTLLAALLRQNPRFNAGMTSPLCMLTVAMLEQMSPAKQFSTQFDAARRRAILRGLFASYYSDAGDAQVVFDTNRVWSGKTALLGELYPESRVICCVRDVGAIIDSVEHMLRKNPLQTSRLFNYKPGGSIYSRVQILMNTETGLIGLPWSALHEAWHGEDASRLILVQYDSLARDPRAVLRRLYAELGEKPFDHNFDAVEFDQPDYDEELGMPGMHAVRPKVEAQERARRIPPELIQRHADLAFWTHPDKNPNRVLVL